MCQCNGDLQEGFPVRDPSMKGDEFYPAETVYHGEVDCSVWFTCKCSCCLLANKEGRTCSARWSDFEIKNGKSVIMTGRSHV